jgi:PAS domain S-box-containing protein
MEQLDNNCVSPGQAESLIDAANALLNLYITKSSREKYLGSVIELICQWSGCRCAGIRVLDNYGNTPFGSYVGYSQEFLESENWLSLDKDQCICIRVMLGAADPQDLPAMTAGGSFRCDNIADFFSALSEEKRERFRGMCLRNGFTSLAVIPIRFKDTIIGVIHLADEKEGMVPLTMVEFIESTSLHIGEAIHGFSTEEELMKYQYHLEELVEERTAMLKAATEKLREEITERKIAAAEVLRAKTYLESILNNTMDMVFTVKRDGTISYINPQSEIITGYRQEEVKGKHFMELVPEHLKKFMTGKWEKINRDVPGRYELEILKADGTLTYCLVSQSLLEGFDEVLITMRDISRRKQVEEALRKSYAEMEDRVRKRTAEIEKVNKDLINQIAERRRIEAALRQSEASLSEAQRIAHLGNWDWNIQMNHLYWSHEIYRIFGLSPQQPGVTTYEAFLESVHPDDREFLKKAVHEAMFENKPYRIDHRIVLPDGTIRVVHEQGEVTFDEAGRAIRMIGTVQDVTQNREAEEKLHAHMQQQAILAELGQHALMGADITALMDRVVTLLSRTLKIEYCKVMELLPDGKTLLLRAGTGWKEGLVGHAVVTAGTESQAGYTLLSHDPVIVKDLRTETRFDGTPLLHDHGVVSGMSVIIYGKDRPFGVLGIHTTKQRTFIEDESHFLKGTANILGMTVERKKAEEELKTSYEQLQKLSAYLQSVREEERANISREIHDELGQVLTALKIEVSMLANKLNLNSGFLLKTESIMQKIDDTIRSVKRICTELRPTILDHFGLSAAIEWQLEEFENLTGIKGMVFFEPNEIILDQDLSTAVFRIFQESLTNVTRHANATDVKVSLKLKDGNIVLEVKDNGAGITKKQFSDPKSFGIMGIKERVNFFGGNVKITGIKNKGTSLIVSIPLRKKEEA